MKNLIAVFVAGVIAAITAVTVIQSSADSASVAELQKTVASKEAELLGYTKYTDYLTLGKRSLSEQMKFLAVQVVREEGLTRVIDRSVLGLSSDATVGVWYKAEYSFGFDLRPGHYDVKKADNGIEVSLRRPVLVATPAATSLRHKILSGGVLTDEKAAVIKIYEGIDKRMKKQGVAMASDEAVVALCEKKLIAFLQQFLAKQPGVKVVPAISIVYR